MKIHITITTFNRPKHLKNLLADIAREITSHEVSVRVYNDGGKKPRVPKWVEMIHTRNHGKQKYWQLISHIWQNLPDADYYIQLPDDFRLNKGFLAEILYQWRNLQAHDKNAICLNPFLDQSRIGEVCWTGFIPQIHSHGGTRYFKTQWNDLAFIAGKEFFEALRHNIQPIPHTRWIHDPLLSSGVGWQVSKRLHKMGKGMYQVRESLVEHHGDESQMNAKERQGTALKAGKLDKIIVGIATIPGREKSFRRACLSILPYCDELHIVDNCGQDGNAMYNLAVAPIDINGPAPDILVEDRGDAGKFYRAGRETEPHYFFSIDDDIEYPPPYVYRLIRAIEMRDRRAVCGYHGKILTNAPINNFYSQRYRKKMYHCRANIPAPAHVSVIGTGCTAYHSDTLPEWNWDECKEPNMADVWFSKHCQERGVPMVVIKHKPLKVDLAVKDTIFDKGQRDPGFVAKVTKAYNSYRDWRVIE